MPSDHIIALLIQERDRLNRAIEALQVSPSPTTAKRRGRPPKNEGSASAPPAKPARKKRTFTAAQRKAASQRM